MKIINGGTGKIFYGLHFYSGIAQYQDQPDEEPYRVFLNEDTLRSMDGTFAGKPVFVEHVNEVDSDLDQLRTEADGWVIESFYNAADGKHWVKFIVVSERGERAVKNGFRLSNAYVPQSFASGGLWNGVPYEKQITQGEYEHLALVTNPRYEESVVMTPEEFKKYNEDQTIELKRIANSKGAKKMKFNFFKKTRVENEIDPELQVILPKSGRSVSIAKLINDAYEKDEDEAMGNKKKNKEERESAKSHSMANMDHMCKMHDGSYMKVKDVLSRHQAMCDELDEMKKTKKDSEEKEMDLKTAEEGVDAEGDLHNLERERDDDEWDRDEHEEEVATEEHKEEMKDDLEEHPEDANHDEADEDKPDQKKPKLKLDEEDEDEHEVKEAKDKKNKKKNELEIARKAAAKVKADKLRNAEESFLRTVRNESSRDYQIDLSWDRTARGKERYGS